MMGLWPAGLWPALVVCLLPVAVMGQVKHTKKAKKEIPKVQYGTASYYANKFEGRKTYTDEIFRQDSLTAASNTLPMHTWVKVTNLRNHKFVFVRINDKMHPRNKRLIDLSRAAATVLGFAGRGLTKVRVDVFGRKRPPEASEEITNAAEASAVPDTTRRPGQD
jgi:rare lipoprotein A